MSAITRAAVDDLPLVVELKLRMFAEAGRARLLAANAATLILEDYRRMYQQGTAAHFLARDESSVLGCAGAFLKDDLPYCYFASAAYGFIGDVFVCPQARHQGIARKLSLEALDWLRSQGIATVRLLASESARSMYASLGFTATDEMALHLHRQ